MSFSVMMTDPNPSPKSTFQYEVTINTLFFFKLEKGEVDCHLIDQPAIMYVADILSR